MGGVTMTKEDKVLLLKDLCARLPYRIKFLRESWNFETDQEMSVIEVLEDIDKDGYINNTKVYKVEDIKPYLFPLSSMTEEQKKEISKRYNLHTYYGLYIEITNHSEGYWDDDNSCNLQDYLWLVDWFNKNHFDYRGLIEKGLAIDATGLNIY